MFFEHGCFGEYLYKIGRERTMQRYYCGGDRDSAQHTLEECPAWDRERRVLIQEIGICHFPCVDVRERLKLEGGRLFLFADCAAEGSDRVRKREREDPART